MSRRGCVICDSTHRAQVDKMLADGQTQGVVQAWLSTHGMTVHRNTISKHKMKDVAAVALREHAKARERVQSAAEGVRVRGPSSQDAALLVRDMGVDRLLDGTLDVTVAETLRAQEILDRRMEKQGDRDEIFALVFAITGFEPPQLPPATFEGTWVTKQLPARVIDPDEWVEPGE